MSVRRAVTLMAIAIVASWLLIFALLWAFRR